MGWLRLMGGGGGTWSADADGVAEGNLVAAHLKELTCDDCDGVWVDCAAVWATQNGRDVTKE
jgi:hypothetical protein